MWRVYMAAIAFSFITDCYGQTDVKTTSSSRSDIFLDIGSIIYGNAASMTLGHQFQERWSAYSCIYIPLAYKPKDTESEENIHREEIDPDYGKVSESYPRSNIFEAGVRFWPGKVYNGYYLALGYLHEFPAKSACTVSAGLHIPVWGNLAVGIAYVKTIYDIDKVSDKLKIGVGYLF